MTDATATYAGEIRRPRNLYAGSAGSIHEDATATKLGFKGGTVAGSVHMDQFPPLLVRAFGDRWFEDGSLSLYFRNATTDGEPVQAFVEAPSGPGDAQVRAWMTRPDGTPVAEGTASAGAPEEPSALFARDLRPVDPAGLRLLRDVHPGDPLGPVEVPVNAERQRTALRERYLTEPLDWYGDASPWGAAIASPSVTVDLLYTEVLKPLKASLGTRVGLFGAIEIRYLAGPVFLDRAYTVSGEIVAVSETPKTEAFWYDSHAHDADGRRVVSMRMMLRSLKASSPLYADK
ncbi:MAG TPA: hypothetical protein VGL93_23635 [Streptosporangiaceae bacterium]|jgi:hypothetical protein